MSEERGEQYLDDPFAVRTRGRICVAVARPSVAETLAVARSMEPLAEVIEIRLDALDRPEILPFTSSLKRPLLFTNRPTWEGGDFAGSEEERLEPLLAAVRAGATYVDFELRADPALRRRLLDEIALISPDTMLILSWHNFDTTPDRSELEKIFFAQYQSGAHVGKIVTMAHTYQDAEEVLALQELSLEKEFPLISFSMGQAGLLSRVATLERGGYMTYAAPTSDSATAPGQLAITDLLDILAENSDGN